MLRLVAFNQRTGMSEELGKKTFDISKFPGYINQEFCLNLDNSKDTNSQILFKMSVISADDQSKLEAGPRRTVELKK